MSTRDLTVSDRWQIIDKKGATPRATLVPRLSSAQLLDLKFEELGWGYSEALAAKTFKLRDKAGLVYVSENGVTISRCPFIPPLHGSTVPWNSPDDIVAWLDKLNVVHAVGNLDLRVGQYQPANYAWDAERVTTTAGILELYREKHLEALQIAYPQVNWEYKGGANYGNPHALTAQPWTMIESLRNAAVPLGYVSIKIWLRSENVGTGVWNGGSAHMTLWHGLIPKSFCPWLATIDNLPSNASVTAKMAEMRVTDASPQDMFNTMTFCDWVTADKGARIHVHEDLGVLINGGVVLSLRPGLLVLGSPLFPNVRLLSGQFTPLLDSPKSSANQWVDVVPNLSACVLIQDVFDQIGHVALVGTVFGGMEFADHVVLLGDSVINTTAKTIEVTPVARGYVFDGEVLATLDNGTTPVEAAQLSAMQVMAINYPLVQRVDVDPIKRTQVYATAEEAGEDGLSELMGSVLIASTADSAAVTMAQANAKASGKEFHTSYHFRVDPSVSVEYYRVNANGTYSVLVDGSWVDTTDDEVLGGYLAGANVTSLHATPLSTLMNSLAGKVVSAGSLSSSVVGEFEEGTIFSKMDINRAGWAPNVKAARDLLQFASRRDTTQELVTASATYGAMCNSRYRFTEVVV